MSDAWPPLAQIGEILETIQGLRFDDPALPPALEAITRIVRGASPTQERIRYVAAAEIAIDDAAAAQDGFNVDQQLARAQAFATLAGVEQARIANLIAWEALQAQRQASTDGGIGLLPLGGDEIAQQIEEGLGLT